jgi:phage FluMu protein Com
MSTEAKEKKFRYPSPIKCPHCRGMNTFAVHTDNVRGIQYRRCRAAICRGVKWSVRGVPADAGQKPPVTGHDLRCPHCEAKYSRQADLTKHLKRVHGTQTGETTNGE